MKKITRNLVLAAVTASSLGAATLARADDWDRRLPPAAAAPAPFQPGPFADRDGYRDRDFFDGHRGGWRARELDRVRDDLARLERERAEALARAGWNPWRTRRIEAWYATRRAELERRYEALTFRRAAW